MEKDETICSRVTTCSSHPLNKYSLSHPRKTNDTSWASEIRELKFVVHESVSQSVGSCDCWMSRPELSSSVRTEKPSRQAYLVQVTIDSIMSCVWQEDQEPDSSLCTVDDPRAMEACRDESSDTYMGGSTKAEWKQL